MKCKAFVLLMGAVLAIPAVSSAGVVINEWNAVSGSNYIKDGDKYFGVDETGFGGADNRLQGNGGNWIELLVVVDHTDMRNWTLEWTEDEEVSPGVTAAGTITFANHATWSDLRAGTIITLIETADGESSGAFDTSTDTSFDPASDDWHINVCTTEEQGKGAAGLLSTITNDGVDGEFSVGNSDWAGELKNQLAIPMHGPVGEGVAEWVGGGINDEEAGALEGPVSPAMQSEWLDLLASNGHDFSAFDDTGGSTFGEINQDIDTGTGIWTPDQDVSVLRDQVPEPATMALLGVGGLAMLRRRNR